MQKLVVVLGVLTVLDLLMLLGALTETLDDFVQVVVNTTVEMVQVVGDTSACCAGAGGC